MRACIYASQSTYFEVDRRGVTRVRNLKQSDKQRALRYYFAYE